MRKLLFSTDIWELYRDIDSIVEEYQEIVDPDELEGLTREELEADAIEYVQEMHMHFAADEMWRTIDELDNKDVSKLRVKMKSKNRYHGDREVEAHTIISMYSFLKSLIDSYRSDLDISIYLQNGKVLIKITHHDATDYIEFLAYDNNNKPKRMSL